MFSLNRAMVVGNLTRDPEMRYTPNGQAVTSFSVATNRRWRDKDGNMQEQTEFHNVVAWGKLAEFSSQWLKKGNRVYVEGRLQTNSWEGQDGSKRNRTEIVAENFIPLTPKGGSSEFGHSDAPAMPNAAEPNDATEFPISDDKPTGKPAAKKESAKIDKKDDADLDEINLDEIPF